jgi:hypothetical protein
MILRHRSCFVEKFLLALIHPPSGHLLRSFSVMCPSSSLPSVIGTVGGVVEAGSPGRAPTGGGVHCRIGQGAPGRALTRARYNNGQGVVNSRREGPSPSLTKQTTFQDQCMPRISIIWLLTGTQDRLQTLCS